MTEAFEHMAPCMFNYVTDLTSLMINPEKTIEYSVTGHDLHTLLFAFMDEMLFRFCTDGFCCVRVEILNFQRSEEFKLDVRA